jgi:hypothetical protein
MTLTISAYNKINADPKRSVAAKAASAKRTKNEARIESLERRLIRAEHNVQELLAALVAMIEMERTEKNRLVTLRQARTAIAEAKGETV